MSDLTDLIGNAHSRVVTELKSLGDLDHVRRYGTSFEDDVWVLANAARKWINIHPSRLHEWHILHIRAGSWGLTHPLDCDLTHCAYQDQAETWREQPDELGNYRWENESVLRSWTRIEEG